VSADVMQFYADINTQHQPTAAAATATVSHEIYNKFIKNYTE